MCRLMGFIGSNPMLLAEMVLWPDRSIIKQSYDARERKGDPNLPFHLAHGSLNGDGFGIGWFSADERREKDPTPCVFTSITPAWNNENLARLACKIVSPLIFAHVRAAYPGMPVSEQNCHPFMYGRYMWMHNGVVAGFTQIKRALLGLLSDVAYNSIQSFHSDSAVSFALFLHHLPDPFTPQAPEVLLKAVQDTILTIGQLQRAAGVTGTSLLNYVVSDGSCMLATRFVSPETADAASLYYAEGAAFTRTELLGKAEPGEPCCVAAPGATSAGSSILHEASYELVYGERGSRVAFVASEPITGSSADWVSVPKNMALVITREKGGYINIMRTALAVPGVLLADPGPPGLVGGGGGSGGGGPGPGGYAMLSKALANGHGGAHGVTGIPVPGLSSQAEVSVCLEAISRGLAAKSRPWLVAAAQSLRNQLSVQTNAAESFGALPERISLEGTQGLGTQANTAAPSAAISRYESMSGNEAFPAAPSQHPRLQPMNSNGAANGAGLSPTADPTTDPADALTLLQEDDTPHFQRLIGHTGAVLCMAIDEDTGRLYTASSDCTIKTWSLVDNACLGSVTAGKKPVTSMVLRGQWLYSGAGRKMRVWDTSRDCICVGCVRIENHCGNIRCMLAVPGRVYLGCQDASVKAFSVDEGEWGPGSETGLSPKGRLSRRASFDTIPAREPDFTTPSQNSHVGAINALALSSAGDLVISASSDAMIRVWRADTLAHVRTLRGHRGNVLTLLVIENLLISGARDNTIRVWDLDLDFMCRCTLTGHKDDITHLSTVTLKKEACPAAQAPRQVLLPCTVVASASTDGTVRLWSLTWTCLAVLALPSYPVPATPSNPTSSRHHSRGNASNGHRNAFSSAPGRALTPVYNAGPLTAGATTPGSGSGRLWETQVPAVLCVSMTGSLVCAGYSDGELRLWPCAGVHLLALKLVAADLGLLPPTEMVSRTNDYSRSALSLRNILTHPASPALVSPSPLSPAHPLMDSASRWANTTANDTAAALPQGPAATLPSVPVPARAVDMPGYQTLAQANLRDVLSALSVHQANASAGTMLSAADSGPRPQASPVEVAGSRNGTRPQLDVPQLSTSGVSHLSTSGVSGISPDGPVGSASTHINRSSGSHLLDTHMRQSLGGMIMSGGVFSGGMLGGAVTPGLATSPTWGDPSGGSPGVAGSPRQPLASLDETLVTLVQAGLIPSHRAANGSAVAAAPAGPAVIQQQQQEREQREQRELGSGNGTTPRGSSNGTTASPSLLTQQLVRDLTAQQAATGASGRPPRVNVLSRDGVLSSNNSGGASPSGPQLRASKGAFGSLVRTDLAERAYADKAQRASSSLVSATHLASCDEIGEPPEMGSEAMEDLELDEDTTLDLKTPAELQRDADAPAELKETSGGGISSSGGGAVSTWRRGTGEYVTCGGAVSAVAGTGAEGSHRASMHSGYGDEDGAPSHVQLLQQLMGRHNGLGGVDILVPPHLQALLSVALERQVNRQSGVLAGLGSAGNDVMMESCLRDFVRIPTVSSNPRMRDECVRGAKFVAKLLESLGSDVKVVRPYDDKNPVVLARLGHDPAKPTVCFYGHYDVQPATEHEWRTNPFELAAVNEHLYGRGTSDNKGPILAFIFAVKELMDDVEADETGQRSLPVNIVFIFEGEEENGSIGFREAVTQNLRWFEGTKLVVISNTNWVGESVPCITYGMRGMMSVSVSVSGPKRDIHSGNDGGVFVEPMMDLIATMATVMQQGGTDIKINGFTDQVAPGLMDLAWTSLQQHGQGEFSREGYQASLGVPALTPPPGSRNLLEARWCRPSLSVVDMKPNAAPAAMLAEKSACYRFGPTRFSVIPATAVAKISVRFVARQDPKHIITCLRSHVHTEFAKLRSPNTIHVHVDALGNWWEADVNSKWMQMAEAAVRREWGCEPLFVREGGTMPVASVLERLLAAPAIMIPMGQSSDSPHLANERIRRTNLIKGKGVIRALLEEVAEYWQPGSAGGAARGPTSGGGGSRGVQPSSPGGTSSGGHPASPGQALGGFQTTSGGGASGGFETTSSGAAAVGMQPASPGAASGHMQPTSPGVGSGSPQHMSPGGGSVGYEPTSPGGVSEGLEPMSPGATSGIFEPLLPGGASGDFDPMSPGSAGGTTWGSHEGGGANGMHGAGFDSDEGEYLPAAGDACGADRGAETYALQGL